MLEEEKKIIKVVRPAGFRDFYPEDYVKVNFILETMKRVAQEFGYVEYVTPAVESLKLYELKSGEGLINETFKVESRTGQKLVLIPELTPSLSRMLAEQQQYYTKPLRWFSIPKCYRDESVQRGRVKEFWQINVDILGMDEIYADAEIIAILVKIITRCGLKKEHFVVRINDRSFMQQFFALLNITDSIPVIQIFDRKDKILQEKIQKELQNKFSLEEATDIALKLRQAKNLDEKIFKIIPDTPETRKVVNNFNTLRKSAFYDELANLGLSREKIDILFKLSEIKDTPEKFIQKINTIFEGKKLNEMMKNLIDLSVLLKAFNILDYVEYDGSLARGLDYYTGIVFEAWSRESTLPRAIAGGGRYDDLVSTIGGSPLAGTGFGFGETVLLQLMDDFKIKFPKLESSDIYIAPIDLTEFTIPLKIADQLRANGWKVILNLFNWKIKRHFENAEKQGNIWMIIIGKKDLANNLVTVRNILTGEQETIPIVKLVSELNKKLKK